MHAKLFENIIIEGDNVTGLKALPDAFVPMTLTSPPYDAIRTYGGHDTWDFEGLAQELYRVTMPGGVVVWVIQEQIVNGSESGESSRQRLYFRDIGFRLHHTMVMSRAEGYGNDKRRYGRTLEYAIVLSKGRPRTFTPIRDKPNKMAGRQRTIRHRRADGSHKYHEKLTVAPFGKRGPVWPYATGGATNAQEKYAYEHPALMPWKMARDFIVSYSRVNDLTFDPFMGAGTTAVQALLNHRRYLGFEINSEYVEIAKRRIKEAEDKQLKRLYR